MSRRGIPEINAGSMADIAFLLLVFFLMVTTIDSDRGILRQLPPPVPDDIEAPEVRQRNVFLVLVNAYNQLLVENEEMRVEKLKDATKVFLVADGVFEDLPEDADLPQRVWVRQTMVQEQIDNLNALRTQATGNDRKKAIDKSIEQWRRKLVAIDVFGGDYKELPPSALISMQNDNNTDYNTYIQVQNELQSAINELRDELSDEFFGVPYGTLEEEYEKNRNNEKLSGTLKDRLYAIRAVYPQRISEAEPKNVGQY